MFKEYDSNTYKEKKIKDRTPFRTAFKKMWNDASFWRFLFFMWIALFYLLFGCNLEVNAAESNVYVDSSYMTEQFENYDYYLIVTDGSGNYVTVYSSAQICYTGTTFIVFAKNDYYGYKTMKIVNDYLVVDENGASAEKWSSISAYLSSNGLSNSFSTVVYSSKDIYDTSRSNTGSLIVGTNVVFSTANNLTDKPIIPDESMPDDENISSVDLSEIILILEEILFCLKSIFTLLSVLVFFLIAEWTANKMRNIVRRFSRYE